MQQVNLDRKQIFIAYSASSVKHSLREKKMPVPRSYDTFFMLNSAEHEIFSANKYENANNSWYFHSY